MSQEKPIHLVQPNRALSACGKMVTENRYSTINPDKVTCKTCKTSNLYRAMTYRVTK